MAELILSCGTDTSDLKTGSPTGTIVGYPSASIITFSVAQTGNIVVGDRVDLVGGTTVYLKRKISTTQWEIVYVTGGPVTDNTYTIGSIKRASNNLKTLISGYCTGTSMYGIISSYDLVALSLKVRIALCKDGAMPDADISIDGSWNTNASYHFEIFSPYNTTTECNTRQRHTYGLKTGAMIAPTGSWSGAGLTIASPYTVVDGIEIHGNISYGGDFGVKFRANYVVVKNCIIANIYYPRFADFDWTANKDCTLHDCLLVAQTTPGDGRFGMLTFYAYETSDPIYVYNNVIYAKNTGTYPVRLDANSGSHIVPATFKNNIVLMDAAEVCVYVSGGIPFDPSYLAGYPYGHPETPYVNPPLSGYNIVSDAVAFKGSSGTGTQISKTNTNIKFKSLTAGSEDFRLDAGSCALAAGIGPGADTDVSVADIIEAVRKGTTADIGAFEITTHLSIIQRKFINNLNRIGTRQPILG